MNNGRRCFLLISVRCITLYQKKGKMPEFGPARGKSLPYPGQKNNITFQKNPYQSLRNLKYECNIFKTVYTVSTIHIGYVLLG